MFWGRTDMAISGDRRFDKIRFEPETANHAVLDATLASGPAHVAWTRLEPLSLTTGAVEVGLSAPVADPLWLLCRQRQFGEFAAEDGGSLIGVETTIEHARIDRFRAGGSAEPGEARTRPVAEAALLEAEVEAEPVAALPERLRAEGGQQLLRVLRAAGAAALVDDVRSTWAFAPPSDDDRTTDPKGAARRAVIAGRVPDAAAVVADLISAGALRGRTMLTLGRVAIPQPLRTRVRNAVTDWRDWLDAYLFTPGESSWDGSRLAYSFAASANMSEGEVTLQADEYDSGTIDWYSFDHDPDTSLDPSPDRNPPTTFVQQGIPQPARYPGMPADRYWEIEDTKVFLGGLDVAPGDLAALALIDYAIQGGTDWFHVPLELPVGSTLR